MDNIIPDNLKALNTLTHMISEETKDEVRLCCRRITRTSDEKSLQDRKSLCSIEEILAKKQRFDDKD
ncbi:MAG: hypothetical protein IJY74_00755 [Oscillospiraceae bacterium]|nr:hypothetical protein [Oscillospiraceae bacterium]